MKEGVDISDFNLSDLPDTAPNFMKHPRGPSDKARQAKKAKLGESSRSRPPAPQHEPSGKSVSLAPSAQTQQIASSLPQPTTIYTHSDTPPSTTKTFQKFNLATTTLPRSEAKMLNETSSPSSSSSSSPESPPYFTISLDTERSDPSSPTLAQLHAQTLASQQPTQTQHQPDPGVTSPPAEQPNPTPSDHQPSEQITSDTPPPNTSAEPQTLNLSPPTSLPPPSEPQNTLPTLEEAILLFARASVDKVKSLTINSGITDDPSAVRTH
ncbi:extensin-like [Lathyrus oleraceus]|uniref:extensin-like n=1 Tax=Pisum sativum TaxID=3888 RepID=UPI0021CE8A42|nr:extensin-like [Pisum sativum]